MNNRTSVPMPKRLLPSHYALIFACVVIALFAFAAPSHPAIYLGDLVRSILRFPAVNIANGFLAILALLFFVLSLGIVPIPKNNTFLSTLVQSDVLFLIAMIGVVLLWRWPYLGHYQLDTDESQDLAATLTLLKDPFYWRSTDTMTHGPLISYVLLIPSLLGIGLDYASARLVGLCLILLSLYALWRVLLRFVEPDRARMFVAPVVLCVAWTTYFDFVAYNAEHMTIFLCVIGGYFGVESHFASRPKSLLFQFLAGFFIGLVPYAKLQGVPIAFALAVLLIAWQWRSFPKETLGAGVKRLLPLLAGIFLPTVLVAFYLVASGLLDHAFRSYVVWILAYGTGEKGEVRHSFIHNWSWPLKMYRTDPFEIWFILSIVTGFLVSLKTMARRNTASSGPLLSAVALFAASYFAVCRPGREYGHYLLFLLFPTGLLNAILWENILRSYRSADLRTFQYLRAGFIGINILLPAVLVIGIRLWLDPYLTEPNLAQAYRKNPWKQSIATQSSFEKDALRVAEIVRSYTDKDSTLCVWGWSPKYHVMTSLPQGTRDSVIYRIITAHGYTSDPYFTQVYLSDLKKSKPTVFIDSVGSHQDSYENRAKFGIQAFPEINTYIQSNYILVDTIDHASIYVRKDRAKSVNPKNINSYEPK